LKSEERRRIEGKEMPCYDMGGGFTEKKEVIKRRKNKEHQGDSWEHNNGCRLEGETVGKPEPEFGDAKGGWAARQARKKKKKRGT